MPSSVNVFGAPGRLGHRRVDGEVAIALAVRLEGERSEVCRERERGVERDLACRDRDIRSAPSERIGLHLARDRRRARFRSGDRVERVLTVLRVLEVLTVPVLRVPRVLTVQHRAPSARTFSTLGTVSTLALLRKRVRLDHDRLLPDHLAVHRDLDQVRAGGSAGAPKPPRPRPPPPPPPPCAAAAGAAAAAPDRPRLDHLPRRPAAVARTILTARSLLRPRPAASPADSSPPAASDGRGGDGLLGLSGARRRGRRVRPALPAGPTGRGSGPAVFVPSIVRTTRPVTSEMAISTLPASPFSQ